MKYYSNVQLFNQNIIFITIYPKISTSLFGCKVKFSRIHPLKIVRYFIANKFITLKYWKYGHSLIW